MVFARKEPVTRRELLRAAAAGTIGLAIRAASGGARPSAKLPTSSSFLRRISAMPTSPAMGAQILALPVSTALPHKDCVFCKLTRIPPCAPPHAPR